MEKTKANFRALREILGYTQINIAEKFGVTPYSVKRWERPDRERNNPPDAAWDFLVSEFTELCESAGESVEKLLEVLENTDGEIEEPITLAYYRTQQDLDRFSNNVPGYVDCNYEAVNRITRAVALFLYDLDIPFEFVYKSEPTVHIVGGEDGDDETCIAVLEQ